MNDLIRRVANIAEAIFSNSEFGPLDSVDQAMAVLGEPKNLGATVKNEIRQKAMTRLVKSVGAGAL